jgi:FRG domain
MDSADDVMRAIGRIGTLQSGRRYVWRGVTNYRWPMRSSLFRALIREHPPGLPDEAEVREREQAIIRAAREWGIGLEIGLLAGDYYMLALLQHHGAPTRLLDVTTNPMTALWFACQPGSGSRDTTGALMALDVAELDTHRTVDPARAPTWGSIGDPLGSDMEVALAKSASDGRPFLIQPSLPDKRMVAQEGLFITGAVPLDPTPGAEGFALPPGAPPTAAGLDVLFARQNRTRGRPPRLPFCVLTIPTPLKSSLLPHLEATYNRTARVMYPDIAGFVNEWVPTSFKQ